VIYGLVAIPVVIIAAVMLSLFHHDKNESTVTINTTTPILSNNTQTTTSPSQEQINDIISKLANIELEVKNTKSNHDSEAIKSAIENLAQQTKQLASHNHDALVETIDGNTTQLETQLEKISKELKALSNNDSHHQYLSIKSLPFTVISIDNIQENNMVTIRYANRDIPIIVGGSLAGWTLIDASQSQQKATFKNKASNYVLVDLSSIDKNT
jgi:hypothetical protein